MSTPLRTIIPLAIVATFLVGYNFLNAAWNAPTANPPNGNTDAPLNTSSVAQIKYGALHTEGQLTSSSTVVGVNTWARGILGAGTEVRSNRYCDRDGKNCHDQFPVCASGKVLISSGDGKWVCGDMVGGGTISNWLMTKQHTEEQCVNNSKYPNGPKGTVEVDEKGNKFCRFRFGTDENPTNGMAAVHLQTNACPEGWNTNGYARFVAWSARDGNQCGDAIDNPWGPAGEAKGPNYYPFWESGNMKEVRTCLGRIIEVGCY